MLYYYQYPLLHRNTFGIDVRTRCFAQYRSVDELRDFVRHRPVREPLFHLGGGSNVLFLSDYPGIILHSTISFIRVDSLTPDRAVVTAGSGVLWDELVSWSLAHGFYGLENLSLIPGEVGAAAVQNIGAYGSEAADSISGIEAVDLQTAELVRLSPSDCHYSYRSSRFKGEWRGRYAVTSVSFSLSRHFVPNLTYTPLRQAVDFLPAGETVTPLRLRQIVVDVRRSKLPDPARTGNAGSFFTNPIVPLSTAEHLLARYPQMPCFPAGEGKRKLSAAWLIDKAGWRGRTHRRAGVYERQPLVLVNLGGATGDDIRQLSDLIVDDVRRKFAITLVPEVNIL